MLYVLCVDYNISVSVEGINCVRVSGGPSECMRILCGSSTMGIIEDRDQSGTGLG